MKDFLNSLILPLLVIGLGIFLGIVWSLAIITKNLILNKKYNYEHTPAFILQTYNDDKKQ